MLVDIFFVGTLTVKYFASVNMFGRVFEVLFGLAKLGHIVLISNYIRNLNINTWYFNKRVKDLSSH